MRPVIALAGQPNSGKTTLFNRLTGANAKVGNYPGVTVERREGRLRLPDGRDAVALDIPGCYSLSARTQEEAIAIEVVAGLNQHAEPDVVVLVVDATQLARNLYLVLQVLELRVRAVVALNMADVLRKNHMVVDTDELTRQLGVPVVSVSAATGEGEQALRTALASVLDGEPAPADSYPSAPLNGSLTADIDAVEPAVPEAWGRADPLRRRALASWALMSLHEDDELWGLPENLRRLVTDRRALAEEQGRDLDLELAGRRYAWIDERMGRFITEAPSTLRRLSDAVDRVMIHPAAGFLLFLAIMAVLFDGLFTWSKPAIDFVEGLVGAFGAVVAAALPEGLLRDFLVDGIIAGVGAVVVFLPQILLLFLFVSIMEDSGYMARVAFMMDRVMKSLGLTGRAFVPMLSGYACAIPAIMATRTMERQRDRMLTMMVVPLMTCSARLPVYTLIIAALFPTPEEPGGTVFGFASVQALLMVAMYVFSTVVALMAAAVLGRTLFKGAAPPLLLELPPYRMPSPRSVVRMMWERSRLFVTEAGTVILSCTVVLWFLLTFPQEPTLSPRLAASVEVAAAAAESGTPLDAAQQAALDDEVAAARLAGSFGGRLGHAIEPAIAPLGFDWKIGIGLVGSFAAREVFVSTMGVVYGVGDDVDETSPPLRDRLQAESWPDGRRVYTPLVGLSLMVFFALAAQCMSTLAVVKRETRSYRWPVFLFSYMTALAWIASFAIYQGGLLLGFA